MDNSFHYTPELLQLLIETLPKLCKSKNELVLSFQAAGVSKTTLRPYSELLQTDRSSFNKYHVTRELLTKLNEQGERSLQVRRELLKRVTEFEDFSVCWEKDQAPARGLVAQIRELINVKDSFTRMRMEKEAEQQKRVADQQSAAKLQQERISRREKAKTNLFALFAEQDAHKRGKLLERVLNELFACHDFTVREAFTIRGKVT